MREGGETEEGRRRDGGETSFGPGCPLCLSGQTTKQTGPMQTWHSFTPGSELQTRHFSLNIRCERFLRAEEEFWFWTKLNQVLLVCSENPLLESLDQSQEGEEEEEEEEEKKKKKKRKRKQQLLPL
ncbi:unnamed protein product [Pleuronectes platessa]|uniref:Uncharacterized protein n=1 Tax=Pleuronectes platessa TaxID=8262 RepID=A0A9N7TNJ7_PLEPL|nr:unnamed protein product [Pleuronectes platessa]